MNTILGLLVIWLIFWGLGKLIDWLKQLFGITPPPSQRTGAPPNVRTKEPYSTYRPTETATRKPTIKFGSSQPSGTATSQHSIEVLTGINDAFTGKRLDLSQAIFECNGCHVYYQSGSVEVLREVNSSRCMVCGGTQITQYGKGQSNAKARNHTPDAVTLQNYRSHLGQVITFTGRVHEVKRSRRGSDFAVMFEQASWTKGLKMVAFRGGVKKIGGEAKLLAYAGKTLTIRGLLINDRIFGPEIIVDDPSMIVRVQ